MLTYINRLISIQSINYLLISACLSKAPARMPWQGYPGNATLKKIPCVKIFQIQKEEKNKRLCFTKRREK